LILPDVSVLVYAHRRDAADHAAFRDWLESLLNGDESYGITRQVLGSFIRVVTHPRVFKTPSRIEDAFRFASQLLKLPNAILIEPGPRIWEIFERLCQEHNARGNLVPDAWFAALTIESGCEWITTDRDFSRFKGLRWRLPLSLA
jgi:toxin-antitoxin system PIN domain toxin